MFPAVRPPLNARAKRSKQIPIRPSMGLPAGDGSRTNAGGWGAGGEQARPTDSLA